MAAYTPSSRSIGGDTSPVKGPSFAQWTFCAPTAISLSASPVTAAARDVKGGKTEMSTLPASPSTRRLSELQNSAVSLVVLFIFQLPAISMGSILRDNRYSRQLLSLQQLERSAAARRGPVDAVDQSHLAQRADRVGAAHDRVARASRNGLGDGAGAVGELRLLEHTHRPVPENGPSLGYSRGEARSRLGADVEPKGAGRNLVVWDELGVGAFHARSSDDVARELDREGKLVAVAELLGHLAA